MARKLTDVDALFLGDDAVDRMFIGETLVWNGDDVPELEASQDAYYDWSSYVPATSLDNLGTGGSSFDLPGAGLGLASSTVWPALIPGDLAYNYQGTLDPTIGVEPYARERLLSQYPYYWSGTYSSLVPLANTGTEGAATVTFETVSAYNSVRSMYFPGVANNYLSVPDAAPLDLTTAIEIVMKVSIFEVDNRLANQRIVAKSGTARGYEVFIGFDSQHASLNFTRDGSVVATATEKLPFLPEHIYWIRVTYTSGSTNFYWQPDNGTSTPPGAWIQLGTTLTNITGSIVANAESLKIGTYNGTGDMFKGRLYRLIIRDAVSGGATVLDIDIPTDTAAMTTDVTTSFTATSGQTVTLTKSGSPPNTVRIHTSGSWFLELGHRFGQATNLTELQTIENQLQIIWVKAVTGGASTTRRELFPIVSAYSSTSYGPYQPNSWTIFFDTLHNEIKFTGQTGSGAADEVFLTGSGPLAGTSSQIYALALLEQGGNTAAWLVRYDATTQSFVYESAGGTSTPQKLSITGTGLIDDLNFLNVWAGTTGFQISDIAITNIPDFCTVEDNVQWDTGDINVKPFVERAARVVALNLAPTYTVGDFWRSIGDGAMVIASEAVEEGDLFAVTSTAPTFRQIKFNHPSRRKMLYRPILTTFGPPSTPLVIDSADDLFMWVVMSSNAEFEYVAYGYDSSTDSFLDMEIGREPLDGDAWVYAEIMDDDGNGGWTIYRGSEATAPIHTIWDRGFSEPTLLALSVDRGAGGVFKAYFYDDSHGLTELANRTTDLLTGDITFDSLWFFGPEEDEGYANMAFYGGGWVTGTGAIPDQDGVIDYWRRAVYGYA